MAAIIYPPQLFRVRLDKDTFVIRHRESLVRSAGHYSGRLHSGGDENSGGFDTRRGANADFEKKKLLWNETSEWSVVVDWEPAKDALRLSGLVPEVNLDDDIVFEGILNASGWDSVHLLPCVGIVLFYYVMSKFILTVTPSRKSVDKNCHQTSRALKRSAPSYDKHPLI